MIFPFSHHDITIFPYFSSNNPYISICLQSLTIFDVLSCTAAQVLQRASLTSHRRRSFASCWKFCGGGDPTDNKIMKFTKKSCKELGVSPSKMVVQQSWNGDWYSHLVGGLEPWNFMTFHSVGNNHPNWLLYFWEGLKPPTRRCWVKHLDLPSGRQKWLDHSATNGDLPIIFQQVTFLICGRVVGIQWEIRNLNNVTICVTGLYETNLNIPQWIDPILSQGSIFLFLVGIWHRPLLDQ